MGRERGSGIRFGIATGIWGESGAVGLVWGLTQGYGECGAVGLVWGLIQGYGERVRQWD